MHGNPERNPQTGKLNPMYGKSPGVNAGIGAHGWLILNGKKIFFRSSLELKVYLYLFKNNISFAMCRHRIKYTDENNIDRTYNPDIVIGNTACEIKPSKMINIKKNILKQNALVEYCNKMSLSNTIITENTYDIKNILTEEKIQSLIDSEILIIDDYNKKKVIKYLGE